MNVLRSAWTVHAAAALALGGVTGAIAAGASLELFLSLTVAVTLATAIGLWASRDHPDAIWIRRAFVAAFLLRLTCAVLLHYFVADRALFAGDDTEYERIGTMLANDWSTNVASAYYFPPQPYYYWNAALFYAFGPHTLLPKAINAVVGSLVVFPLYRLAMNCFEDRMTARVAAGLGAALPSLVLWSALNLRDPAAILVILLLVDAVVQLRLQPTLMRALLLLPPYAMLGAIRAYMVLVVSLGLGLGLVVVQSRHALRDFVIVSVGAAALLVVIRYLGFAEDLVDTASLDTMNTMREGLRLGGSALEKVDISTPAGAAAQLPLGLASLLFAPFPWQIRSFRQLFSLPEVLLFYATFPFVVMGAIGSVRQRPRAALPALGVLVTVLCAYALVEGNLGTAYRHKAQVLGLLFLFGSGGFVAWWKRRQARVASAPFAMGRA